MVVSSPNLANKWSSSVLVQISLPGTVGLGFYFITLLYVFTSSSLASSWSFFPEITLGDFFSGGEHSLGAGLALS